tara:strand:+ start:3675 stop:5408 length:1734 start_codon:yes stop_codon:yes gene_type:complete
MKETIPQNGGYLVAEVLQRNNVQWIFTLCGGHISPILTACNQKEIKVIDVRHEATAVFAADAVSRLSNNIGVAAVTAGPGLTNIITAITNAQLAQVPLLILGGATATVLKGRGSLQDINQLALVKSNTKFSATIKRVRDIKPTLEKVISISKSGVPGPVYIELPVDILYPESIVREWYGLKSASRSMPWWLTRYLNWNVNRIFKNKDKFYNIANTRIDKDISYKHILKVVEFLNTKNKPVLLIGSQAMSKRDIFIELANAVKKLNIPTYVSGMARGLLSKSEMPIYRHARKKALQEADGVILAGVACDFRLDYGRNINHKAKIISINLSRKDLYKNRKPQKAIIGSSSKFLISLSKKYSGNGWGNWHKTLLNRDHQRIEKILTESRKKTEFINPLKICTAINEHTKKGDIIIADGGDFVATASYIIRPCSLGGWLDPGVFGTLGVGAGFILGSYLSNPDSIIWAIYGDGAFGYSLMEFDTFIRHKIPVIAVIGNDAGWTQITRDQVEILKDPIGTSLTYTKYHEAIIALGGVGFSIENENDITPVLLQARKSAEAGNAVSINVKIGKTDFRKGSISI